MWRLVWRACGASCRGALRPVCAHGSWRRKLEMVAGHEVVGVGFLKNGRCTGVLRFIGRKGLVQKPAHFHAGLRRIE